MLHFFAKIIIVYTLLINASCSNSAQKLPNEGNNSVGANGQETNPKPNNDPSISKAAELLGMDTNKKISLNDITKEFGKKLFDNIPEKGKKVQITENVIGVFLDDKAHITNIIDIFNDLLDKNKDGAVIIDKILSELDYEKYIAPILKYSNGNTRLGPSSFTEVLKNLKKEEELKGGLGLMS